MFDRYDFVLGSVEERLGDLDWQEIYGGAGLEGFRVVAEEGFYGSGAQVLGLCFAEVGDRG